MQQPAQPPVQPSGNSTLVVVTAIYMIVIGILGVCGSLASVVGGSLLGGLGGFLGQSTAGLDSESAAAANEAIAAASSASGFLTIIGLISLVIAIAAIVIAVGLFMKKPWAYMGVIVVNVGYIIVAILGILFGGGFGIVQLVPAIISAVIVYLFYTDAATKAAFGRT